MTPVLILDLDGTLYNSKELDRENEEAALHTISDAKSISIQEAALLLSEKRKTSFGKTSISKAIKALGINDDLLKANQILRMNPEAHLKYDEELVKLLRKLKSSFKIVLLTNTRREIAHEIIQILGFSENDFDLIVAGGDGYQPKPNKATLKKVMELMDGTPSNSYSIGDRWLVDLEPAIELGISAILIHSRDELVTWLRSKITANKD